jgi:3-methylcrotonyl-CoA carboxylase alpha subunit
MEQRDLHINGHAVEARLYAEEPERGFLPSTGTLHALQLAGGEGIRIDSGVVEGGAVTPFYDPMIAKVIAHGPTRNVALDRLRDALTGSIVAGPKTNTRFLCALLDHPDFRAARLDTGLIERNLAALGASVPELDRQAVAAGALALIGEDKLRIESAATMRSGWAQDPWSEADGFSLAPGRSGAIRLRAEQEDLILRTDATASEVLDLEGDYSRDFILVPGDAGVLVLDRGRQTSVTLVDALDVAFDDHGGDAGGTVKSPMHGKLVALFVAEGDTVEKGQRLAIVEAMKMEHPVLAPRAGIVEAIAFEAGAQLGEGARILSVAEIPVAEAG